MTKKKTAKKEPKLEWRATEPVITDGNTTVRLFYQNGKLYVAFEFHNGQAITMSYDHFNDLVDKITNTSVSEYRV